MVRHPALLGASVVFLSLLACKALDKQQAAPAATTTTAAASSPSTEVDFKRLVPKVGTKSTVSRKTTMKFTSGGKTFRETSVLDATSEVKASDEFRVTKASITVRELYTTSQEGSGAEKKSVSPLAGSTYIVSRYDNGSLGAQDGSGNQVASTTLKLIKDEFGSGFEKSNEAAFLPDHPVKIEEKLIPSSDAVLRMLEIKDDGNTVIDGTEFILKSSTDSRATFDATMTMTQKAAGMRVRAKLKGKLELRPEGAWLVGVDLTGPLTLLDSSGNEKGTGDLTLTGTQTFE